ncbi:alcohol dehydrogenase catalytic domain-containing protein [Actinoplanes lutulentus]|uniref:alcohol dehydrogenase catalytic domain-containing protein n=1 Tax=Actinoplanes lutulentus TaxID=1287878 RepID=UPI001FE3E842|nr:alcohol dehydrogenase catalytic domain-containing protein [Actinoplanes lutulentus]
MSPFGAPVAELPSVFGGEAAGAVEQVGADLTDFAPGDEVFGQAVGGTFAEYPRLPAAFTVHKPATVSFEDAATLPITTATAHDPIASRSSERPQSACACAHHPQQRPRWQAPTRVSN